MATFVSINNKTKVIVRKQGYPTHCKTFLKKSDGIIWARKVESEMERGLFEDTAKAKTILFSTVLDKYYASCVARNLKALRFIKAHSNTIKTSLGQLRLIEVDSQCLASYRDQRLTSVSAATAKLELGIIIRTLKFAVNEMGIYLPYFPQVKYPTVSNSRHRRASNVEINMIKENISNPEILVIIDLAIQTAMRRGEILNIQWQHISWTNNTLLIPETKTGQPRKVPLTAKAVTSLRQLEIKDLGLVFSVKADSVSQAFKRACVTTDIDDLRFHDLRHEATTRLFELGLNVIEVGAITGHKDLKMLNRYTHLNAERLGEKLRNLQE
jgi:integrase